jgi:hypothetical protein
MSPRTSGVPPSPTPTPRSLRLFRAGPAGLGRWAYRGEMVRERGSSAAGLSRNLSLRTIFLALGQDAANLAI